ncbi:MAG: T9SS type A sorting domain-containing protein [bacterium]
MIKYIYLFIFFVPLISFAQNESLIIDHTKVQEFYNLNEESLPFTAELRMMFRHASVGNTINNGLDCVQGTRTNPKECTEFEPYKYDRRNWDFQGRGNSGWKGKVNDFVDTTEDQIEQFDIFSFKFCYLEGLDEISEPCGKPFNETTTESNWNYLKNAYETLESKYPEKIFIWWTIPLTQSGQYCTEQMNTRIRNYCRDNGKILFDIADIEAYDTLGNHVTNAQGWEIAFNGYCGEKTGPSCHPNWLGSIMLAKAFWYMMVTIAEGNYLSVDELNNDEIKISPNPATDYIEINIGENGRRQTADGKRQGDIKIYNTLGECIMKSFLPSPLGEGQGVRFDVSGLPVGMYFVRVGIDVESFLKL